MLILRALLGGTSDGSVHSVAMEQLSDYPFLENMHQILFDSIRQIPSDDPAVIRAELPRRVTLSGFPEIQLALYFEPVKASVGDIIVLVETLRRLAIAQHRSKPRR